MKRSDIATIVDAAMRKARQQAVESEHGCDLRCEFGIKNCPHKDEDCIPIDERKPKP